MSWWSDLLGGAVAPIAGVVKANVERKQAHETLNSQLLTQKETDETNITVSKDQLEAVLSQGLGTSWKDEYATLSILSIINGIVVGGVLHGFGYPQFMQGILIGVEAMNTLGIHVGALVTTVVAAAIGVTTLKRLL